MQAEAWSKETEYTAARRFLMQNPQALLEDAELLTELGLRLDAANVVDFNLAALARVSAAHRREATAREQLEATARENFTAQAQAHGAVLDLLEARSLADLARRADDLAKLRFGLAGAVLALECDDEAPAGWRRLVEGQVEMIMGAPGAATRMGVVAVASGLFGARAPVVASMALVRLSIDGRAGVLAFGAMDAEGFSPDMGAELVLFLARVVERTAERWPPIPQA